MQKNVTRCPVCGSEELEKRDVFISYSSQDQKLVLDIVQYLEKEGYTCFVAFRNLWNGVGAENYVKSIQDAIKSCKCCVFISSEHSRRIDCDAMTHELPYIVEHCPDMGRIEYLAEPYGEKTSTATKAFLQKTVFAGMTWCTNKEDLSMRIQNCLKR